MKEHPINQKAHEVQAILDGRRTQLREVIKPQPTFQILSGTGEISTYEDNLERHCPYGAPGDLLWVRETWADVNSEGGPGITWRADCAMRFCADDAYPVEYDRYPGCQFTMWCGDLWRGEDGHKWRPSIHMPRWASRIQLRITDVRAERLQEITVGDAQAEGVNPPVLSGVDISEPPAGAKNWSDEQINAWIEGQARATYMARCADIDQLIPAFHELWDSINAQRGYGWNSNPWVWVVSFERVTA